MSASANNPEPPPEGGACDQKAALQPIASAYSTDPFQNSVQESKEELAFTADARLLDESAEGLAPALVGGVSHLHGGKPEHCGVGDSCLGVRIAP